MAQPRIAVVLEGGLVVRIVSDDPALIGTDVVVYDYDTDGSSPDELTAIKQADGSYADAYARVETIDRATVDLADIYRQVDAHSAEAEPRPPAGVAALA